MAEVHTDQTTAGHELSDLSPRSISYFGVGLAALIFVALLVVYAVIASFRQSAGQRAERPAPLSITTEPRPGPHLSVDPGQSMKAVRQQEEARLKSYGWIDQEKGIVHVPIERAIEMLAKKGLPARPGRAPAKGDSQSADKAGAVRQER